PRTVLGEMGCVLPDDIEIRVWDSSAEVRYLVLPERPPGTDGLDVAEDEPSRSGSPSRGTGRRSSPKMGARLIGT
ncbi:MAG TPA: nitrile hydratase subunit alpha, partial [Streptosporangiaceae bacterium]